MERQKNTPEERVTLEQTKETILQASDILDIYASFQGKFTLSRLKQFKMRGIISDEELKSLNHYRLSKKDKQDFFDKKRGELWSQLNTLAQSALSQHNPASIPLSLALGVYSSDQVRQLFENDVPQDPEDRIRHLKILNAADSVAELGGDIVFPSRTSHNKPPIIAHIDSTNPSNVSFSGYFKIIGDINKKITNHQSPYGMVLEMLSNPHVKAGRN